MDLEQTKPAAESIAMGKDTLSIVIPTHRRPDHLRRLLSSLVAVGLGDEEQLIQVIVVANLADPKTRQVANSFRGWLPIVYLEGTTVGVNAARNLGLRQAKGEIIAFLDDDCVLDDPLYVEKILALHKSHPEIVAIGGTYSLGPDQSDLEKSYHSISSQWMSSPAGAWRFSWRLVGGNVSYKRSQLIDRGLFFCEKIVFGGAETELHQRMERLGLKAVLHSDLSVVHDSHLTFWGLVRRAVLQGMQAGQAERNSPQTIPLRKSFSYRAYQAFFDIGHAYGKHRSQAPVRLHFLLVMHALIWAPIELLIPGSAHQSCCRLRPLVSETLPSRMRNGRDFVLGATIKWMIIFYWRVYRWYWGLYRWHWKPRAFLQYRVPGAIKKFSVISYWKLYKWHWIIRGPLQYQMEKRLDFIASPLSQGKRLAFRSFGAAPGGTQRPSSLTVDEHSPHQKEPLLRWRSWLLSRWPLLVWSTETLHQLWWERCRVPKTPSLILTSWSTENFHEMLRNAQRRGFRRVLIEISDPSMLAQLADLKPQIVGLEIEVLLPPAFWNETMCLELMDRMKAVGFLASPYLACGTMTKKEKETVERLLKARRFSTLCVSPFVSKRSLRWFGKILHKSELSEVRIVDVLHRSYFEYSTGLATVKAVLWSWPQSLRVVIDIPVRPHLDHLSVPTRWPSARCVDLSAKQTLPKEWSIIIPCFQNTEYLPAVISHIGRLDYDLNKIEVLIVDDGSEVALLNSAKDLASLAEKLAIRVVRIERRDPQTGKFDSSFRAGIARNSGFDFAVGNKILFIDSDIVLPNDHLFHLDQALENADVVQSVRHMLTEQVSGPEFDLSKLCADTDIYPEEDYWEKFKSTTNWQSLSAPWKYVCTYHLAMKRAVANGPVLFRPEFCEYGFEDTEFGYRKMKEGWRFHLSHEPVYHLYPVHRSTAHHFNAQARRAALKSTSRLFFRMHLDPAIAKELDSVLAPERYGYWESAE